MKGDPGGEITCPRCGATKRASRVHRFRNGYMSTRRTLRGMLAKHVYDHHWELTLRESSELLDRALETARFGGDVLCVPDA